MMVVTDVTRCHGFCSCAQTGSSCWTRYKHLCRAAPVTPSPPRPTTQRALRTYSTWCTRWVGDNRYHIRGNNIKQVKHQRWNQNTVALKARMSSVMQTGAHIDLIYWRSFLTLQVFAHHRELETIWHKGKVKLHQRLGVRLFQQDTKQVTCFTDSWL